MYNIYLSSPITITITNVELRQAEQGYKGIYDHISITVYHILHVYCEI